GGDSDIAGLRAKSACAAVILGVVITVLKGDVTDDVTPGSDSDIAAGSGADSAQVCCVYPVIWSVVLGENIAVIIHATIDISELGCDRDAATRPGTNGARVDNDFVWRPEIDVPILGLNVGIAVQIDTGVSSRRCGSGSEVSPGKQVDTPISSGSN